MKTKILALLALGTCLTVVGCDDPSEPDDELREMIELCDFLEDCDLEIDAMLDEADDEEGPDADFGVDLAARTECTHCDDTRDDFAIEPRPTHSGDEPDHLRIPDPPPTHGTGIIGADDVDTPEPAPDPDPTFGGPGTTLN